MNNKPKANMYIQVPKFSSFIEIARSADYWIKLDELILNEIKKKRY